MNCRKVQNLISAYIDSELTGIEMLAIRDHVNHCGSCDQEYKSLLRLKRSFGRMSTKQPSEDLALKICSILTHEPEAKQKRTFTFPHINLSIITVNFRYAAVGACILSMLLLLSAGAINNSDRRSSEYHMELSSLISDDQNVFTSYYGEQLPASTTGINHNNRRFNMPWGLSNKTQSTPLLSHDTQMVFASY